MSRANSIQISALLWLLCCWQASGADYFSANHGNFGLPGTLDMPIGEKLTDGEVVISQSVSLWSNRLAAQVLPYLVYHSTIRGKVINQQIIDLPQAE